MTSIAIFQPKLMVCGYIPRAIRGKARQVIKNVRIVDPVTIRVMTVIIMVGVLLVVSAGGAQAQGGDEITTAFSGVVETIVGIIQGLAVVVGIAGLSVWGLARIARPIFPELGQLTNQYIGSLVIGVVIVFVAATVVEGLASAVGG